MPIFYSVGFIVASLFLTACGKQENDSSDLSATTYPTCSASATDPDGDGWGWESSTRTSCRMAAAAAPNQQQQAPIGACAYLANTTCSSTGSCRIYPDNGTRATIKSQIWDAMYALNKSNYGDKEASCRADLSVAIAMQEAHSFAADSRGNLPYDSAKDSRTDGSQNVSIFNINIDFIKLSCKIECGKFQNFSNQNEKKYLNQASALKEAVRRLNEGFDFFGIDKALFFHRGGRNGWQRPTKDERAYADAQKVVANHLKNQSVERKSDKRIAYNIVYR